MSIYFIFLFLPDTLATVKIYYGRQARIQRGGGGAGSASPPLFVPNSFKNPLSWPKKSWERAPEAIAPPPFSNPGCAPGSNVFRHIFREIYRASSISVFRQHRVGDCFSIGPLWVSKCLSMNICSQANVV